MRQKNFKNRKLNFCDNVFKGKKKYNIVCIFFKGEQWWKLAALLLRMKWRSGHSFFFLTVMCLEHWAALLPDYSLTSLFLVVNFLWISLSLTPSPQKCAVQFFVVGGNWYHLIMRSLSFVIVILSQENIV